METYFNICFFFIRQKVPRVLESAETRPIRFVVDAVVRPTTFKSRSVHNADTRLLRPVHVSLKEMLILFN